jgi:hypothetical protein
VGLLALGVVAGTIVGFYGLTRVLRAEDAPAISSPTPSSVEPEPTTTPDPSATTTPPGGQDIGLGFPVCNVTSVAGAFAPDVRGTAYVATRMSDLGGCPQRGDAFQVVAVDVTGDGVADASYGPIACENLPCAAFAAPDVDGDGTDELLIQNIAFSIAGVRLYEVRPDPAEVFPVTVGTPGYPEGGAEPGEEPQFWIGGDAFDLDTLRCVDDSRARFERLLIQTSATQVPPDSPDSVWRAATTWFGLNGDGTLSIVDVETFEEPIDQDPPSFAQGDGVCGARIANRTF